MVIALTGEPLLCAGRGQAGSAAGQPAALTLKVSKAQL